MNSRPTWLLTYNMHSLVLCTSLVPSTAHTHAHVLTNRHLDDMASPFKHLASPLEKAMAPHSSTLAWKIPWTEEPGGLQSMGSQRVGHN